MSTNLFESPQESTREIVENTPDAIPSMKSYLSVRKFLLIYNASLLISVPTCGLIYYFDHHFLSLLKLSLTLHLPAEILWKSIGVAALISVLLTGICLEYVLIRAATWNEKRKARKRGETLLASILKTWPWDKEGLRILLLLVPALGLSVYDSLFKPNEDGESSSPSQE